VAAVLPAPPCPVPPTADCGHPDVAVAPGDASVRDVVVPELAGFVAPPGEVPFPAGLPWPSVPDWPGDCPPVSTFELTCTIT
jgi:hypothetical protein